jgi:ribosome biogenesis protein ENP2
MVFLSRKHHRRIGGQCRWRANRLRGLQIRIPCRARYVRGFAHSLSTIRLFKCRFPSLSSLGLDHLVGTPALKPYMHGYFLSLKLYDAARIIVNPYVYEEHRAKVVQEKLDKLAEGRIRARKDQVKVKVNKALAEKIAQEEERTRKREERKRKKAMEDGSAAMDVDGDEPPVVKQKASLLSDARFTALFEDPEFEVDEETREYALLNPSTSAQKKGHVAEAEGKGWGRGKTAVEDEEEESDKISSDGLGDSEDSSGSEGDGFKGEAESEDSSEAGGTLILLSRTFTSNS